MGEEKEEAAWSGCSTVCNNNTQADAAVTTSQILQQRQKHGGYENSILTTNDIQVLGVRLTAGAGTAVHRGGGRTGGGADVVLSLLRSPGSSQTA